MSISELEASRVLGVANAFHEPILTGSASGPATFSSSRRGASAARDTRPTRGPAPDAPACGPRVPGLRSLVLRSGSGACGHACPRAKTPPRPPRSQRSGLLPTRALTSQRGLGFVQLLPGGAGRLVIPNLDRAPEVEPLLDLLGVDAPRNAGRRPCPRRRARARAPPHRHRASRPRIRARFCR